MKAFVILVIFASVKAISHFTQNGDTNLQMLQETEKVHKDSNNAVQKQLVLKKGNNFGVDTVQKQKGSMDADHTQVEALREVLKDGDYGDQKEVKVLNAVHSDGKVRKDSKTRFRRDESSERNKEKQNIVQKLAKLKQAALQNGVKVSNGIEEQAKLKIGTRMREKISQMLDTLLEAFPGLISCDSIKIGHSLLSVLGTGLTTFVFGPEGKMAGDMLSMLLSFLDSPNCNEKEEGKENFEELIKTAFERYHRDEIDEDINGLLEKLMNAQHILTDHYKNGITNYTESDLDYILNGIPANIGLVGLGKIEKFLQEDAEKQRNVTEAEQFLNRVSAYVNLKALRSCILSIKYQIFIGIRHMNKAFHVRSNLRYDLKSSRGELRFLIRPKSAKGILVSSIYDAEKWPNIHEYMKIMKSVPEYYQVGTILNALKMRFKKITCRPGYYISVCSMTDDGYTNSRFSFSFEHQDGYPQNIRIKCVNVKQTYYESRWWRRYAKKSDNYPSDTYISDVPCYRHHFLNYGHKWNLPIPLVRSKPDGYNLKLILLDSDRAAGFIVSRANPDRFLNLYKKQNTEYKNYEHSEDDAGFYRFQNSARQIMYNPMVLEFYDGNITMGKEYHANVPDDSCDGHCPRLYKCDRP